MFRTALKCEARQCFAKIRLFFEQNFDKSRFGVYLLGRESAIVLVLRQGLWQEVNMRTFTPKVMVISDNEATRFFLDFFLTERGFQVNYSRRLVDYVMDTSWELPDLFLLEHDGDTRCANNCKQLKRNPKRQDVPVLVISSTDYAENVGNLLDAGADDVLLRPFNSETFRIRINQLLYPSPVIRGLKVSPGVFCQPEQNYLH